MLKKREKEQDMRINQTLALAAAISIGLANAAFAAKGGAAVPFLPHATTTVPAAPGMDNGIGYGVGNTPSPGTVRGANASGAGVGTNPTLQGGLGAGTGMVPKPAGQGY
jgi:hypothetical protein